MRFAFPLSRSLSRWSAAFVMLAAAASPAAAQQTFPWKPVTIVATFAPGGASDILARLIAPKLSERLGQPVLVENRAGAGGNIGTDHVAKSAPDGHTLVMGYIGTHAVNPTLYKKIPFDAVKDFAPVAFVASIPSVLVVHPSVPVKSVSELTAFAKANPGKLNYGSGGAGTAPHLGAELFKTMTGVEMVHIPYKGSGPAVTDLLGGQISLMFNTMIQTIPHVQSGKLRALAVTSAKRSQAMPELPTIAEAGLPGYEMVGWFGLLAPAGTPKDVVARLNDEIVKILNLPDVKDRLEKLGSEPTNIVTPEQFGDYIKSEIAKWAKVIKASGMQID
jgi:tripartite-type tricarboxylate transporter receptor subunit TctC